VGSIAPSARAAPDARPAYHPLVSLIERLMRRVGRDLDRSVQGASGIAHVRFSALADNAPLALDAELSTRGTLEARVRPAADSEARPREERGQGKLSFVLEARPHRGATVEIVAEASRGEGDLAVLTLTLTQSDPEGPDRAPLAQETYSVESRFDDVGRAHLELKIDLG
jgi:hypothetical protein